MAVTFLIGQIYIVVFCLVSAVPAWKGPNKMDGQAQLNKTARNYAKEITGCFY